uniref:Uncharacterized protein n=1 Tax=Anguilla anguilla TaxID=7936 RepID=A0A0E9QXI7_ANGAN
MLVIFVSVKKKCAIESKAVHVAKFQRHRPTL